MRLGIDIGGTKVAFALGRADGEILARSRRPTDPSGNPQADLRRMGADARRLVEQAGVALDQIAAVGVSVPGPLDADRGTVLHPPNLVGWGEVPVRDILMSELGLPVVIENDANAAALAEWRYGAGRAAGTRPIEHLVYLTMSTGVGAGLVLDGRIYRGRRSLAGELGHAPVEWDGLPCACGLKGCLEAYVGGAAWAKRLRANAPSGSDVVSLAGDRESVTPEHVVRAARAGDAYALAEMERFNHYLSHAIVQLVFTLAPDAVVLGTIPVAAGEELCFAPLRQKVDALLWPQLRGDCAILPAALGDDLPYRAALCAADL
jgi:glucokinase